MQEKEIRLLFNAGVFNLVRQRPLLCHEDGHLNSSQKTTMSLRWTCNAAKKKESSKASMVPPPLPEKSALSG